MSSYTQARERQLSNIRAYENRARQSLTRAAAGPSGPSEIASRGGGFASVGESYGPGTRAQSAAANSYGYFKSWVYVSVDAIARRAAGQPFCAAEMEGAEPTDGQRGPVRYGSKGPRVNPPWASKAIPSGILERATVNQELTVYQSHAVLDLLARPNPLQKKSEFVYMTVANILLTGESFWIGGEDDAGNFELWAVPTHWVIPDHSRGMYASYKLQVPGAAVPKELPDGAVCRIYLPNPADLKSALSPLSTAIRAIRVDDHIQASQEEMFKRGINPNLIVTIGKVRGEDGNLTDRRPVLRGSHRRQIIRAIREIWDQTVSSGDPAILDGLIESVHKLHNTPQEMDWPGSGEIVKKRVMQTYKVNPIVVGEITAGNRAQAVEAEKNFCSNAVNPLVSSISDAATDYLGPRYQTGKPLVVYLELAQPIDPEQQLREWTEARKNEDVTSNEFRAQILGIAPLDDRDDPARLLTQQGGLTGITTLMEKVGAGSIAPEQAAETLVVTLRLPRDQAEKIAGVGIARPEPPAPPPVPVPVPPPEPPEDDEDDDEQSDDEPPEPADENPADESGGERAARPFGRFRSIRDFIQARAKSASTAVERRAGQDLARYFRGSVRRITDGILAVDWVPNPTNAERQAETLIRMAFDGPAETRKLKEAATDSMLHAFAVGAMTEIQTLAEIVRGRNRKTTAEDIAARLGYDVPDGVSIGQYPDWLQRAAVDSLGDTFSELYWSDVPETTATDIYNVLVSAIREGRSIPWIASEIARQCGPAYSVTRARNVARTEMTGAMNAGHVAGMVQIQEETGLPIGKEWVSVMGSTTRDSHAAADGQQSADPDGLFRLASYSVPYPGHHSLPAAERCNCQCTAISSIVMDGLEDAVADTPVEPATPDAWDQASVDKMDAKTIVADHPALQEKLSRVLELRDSYKPKMGALGREYEDVRQQIRAVEKQFADLVSTSHPIGSDEERRQIEQSDLFESQRAQLAKRRDAILAETKQIAEERREKSHKILTIKTEKRLGAKASYLKHTKNDPLATELDDEGYRLSLGGYPDGFKKKVGEAQEFLGKVVAKPRDGDLSMTDPREPFSKSDDKWAKTIQIHRAQDGCRSRHVARTAKWKGELLRDAGVYCTDKDNTEIIVHEMAHHLEASVPGIAKRSREFQKYRIAKSGRPNVKMRDVFPDSGYGAREVGNEDDFAAAFDRTSWTPGKEYPSDRVDKSGAKSSAFYAGKNYNNKETELTSMGMELLYVDPAGFAARDPEFFKFIVGTLDGTIR